MDENINNTQARLRKNQGAKVETKEYEECKARFDYAKDNLDDNDDKSVPPLSFENSWTEGQRLSFNVKQQWQFLVFFLSLCISMYFLTIYNERQLIKIKEEYAMNVKHEEFWWQKAFIYRIDVGQFVDSNKDGVGDFLGIVAKIELLNSLLVDAILIENAFSQTESGAILNFYDAHSKYGGLEEFKQMISVLKESGVRVLLRVRPNQTSKLHNWFVLSETCGDCKEKDYYIWADCSPGKPPNNWKNNRGESIWNYSEVRKQCYLSQLGGKLADLNFRNVNVINEFKNIFKKWLKLGIDGFLLDELDLLYEEEDLSVDEVVDDVEVNEEGETIKIDTSKELTRNRHEVYDLLALWREVFDTYQIKNNVQLFISCQFLEPDMPSESARYFDTGIDAPIKTFNVVPKCGSMCFYQEIDSWITEVPSNKVSSWGLDGKHSVLHDLLIMTLPGTAFIQRNLSDDSALKTFERLSNLRKEHSFLNGKFNYAVITNSILSYVRYARRFLPYLVAVNFGEKTESIDFTESTNYMSGEIMAVTNPTGKSFNQLYQKVGLKDLKLNDGEGVVIRLLPDDL
ncbi:DgyrCDS6743 [Dimorphilus gyrociliatus]|uniref:DgyrCDS6743 n=1 Tax=Dimorphilus gyrociliatus TaxID=2664684 RepID=A0A7I8VNX6_9ANNE|nr:DgyrCDS6743 [Dimorphilus gyrociliatus]